MPFVAEYAFSGTFEPTCKTRSVLLVFGLEFGFCDGAGCDLAPVANCDAVVISVFWIAG